MTTLTILYRRRYHTSVPVDRPLSTVDISGLFSSTNNYHGNGGNRHINSSYKYAEHYKSCNLIGSTLSTAHDSGLARSIHHINDSSRVYSDYGRRHYSSSSVAVNSEGLEYICNFKSTHPLKVTNQVNERLMQTRSGNDWFS